MLLNVTCKLYVILTRKYILKADDTVQSVATNVLKRGQQPYSDINEVLNKWNYTWSVNNLHNTITWIYETNCLYIFNLVLSIGRIFFLLSWIIYLTFFKNQIIKNGHNWYWGCSIALILKRIRNKGCVFFFTFFLSGWSDTN